MKRLFLWLVKFDLREQYSLGDFDGYLRGFEEGVEYGRRWPAPWITPPENSWEITLKEDA